MADSDTLQSGFEGDSRFISPFAELIKRNADREDITFNDIKQADLLILFYSFCNDVYWYPNTLNYTGYNYRPELFIRAAQRHYFKQLEIVAGMNSVKDIKLKIKEGAERMGGTGFRYGRMGTSLESMMNFEYLDSLI